MAFRVTKDLSVSELPWALWGDASKGLFYALFCFWHTDVLLEQFHGNLRLFADHWAFIPPPTGAISKILV